MNGFFKFLPALVLLSISFSLTGCSSESAGTPPEIQAISTAAATAVTTTESTTEITPEPAPEATSKTSLVAYFSWSGNTQQIAEWIADESGSDIYRITPAEAYGTDFDSCSDRAKNELDNGIRPELKDLMDTQAMAQYDTIYVGFPIWWYDLPMPVTAFLENYDLSGKTIIPFFSHNGSSSGASAPATLAEICTGANVLAGEELSISGNDVENSETKIREWVNQLKK